MNKNNVDEMEEKQHDKSGDDVDDEKHIEIEVDNNNKPLIQVETLHDSSSAFSFYEDFHRRELLLQQSQQQNQTQPQHTDSHDSLLQPDHHMNNINTAASSTDDLSTTHQLSSSVFHSKDSALGLSDDNLHYLQTNPQPIKDDDEDDDDDDDNVDDDQDDLHQQDKTIDNNVIQDNANNNNDKNEMTYEHINDDTNSLRNKSTMIFVPADQTQSLPSPYRIDHGERTISSSSSEQLIPKEKQTGMYYPAFGSTAAIQLAEKYNCEWVQDITSPSSTYHKSPTNVNNEMISDSRIFHQHQALGDEDEFYLSLQTLQPSHSCPHLNYNFIREPLRERSYSLTTLDAYARLDITRDTLEQMWLSLLDLAFSDKDDVELGEYKLRHIMGLSNSYTHINDTLIEKSRSHGDIFSSANKSQQLTAKKSKSFDITSLPKSTKTSDNEANVGLLQGAAISEPFVDRIGLTSTQSDTEMHFLGNDDDDDNDGSVQSLEQDHLEPEEQYSPQNPISSPVIKEPLNYVFHYPHQLDNNDDFDFEPEDDITNYLPETTLTMNQLFGDEDKQLCMSLGFDDDEATAAFAAAVAQPRDIQAILADYRPHSLSTIPSSRASQYASSVDDSDEIIDNYERIGRKNTISFDQEEEEEVYRSDHSINGGEDVDEDLGQIESNLSSPPSRALSPIQNYSRTSPAQLPKQTSQLKLPNFANIDHDAWVQSINESIYSENLSVQKHQHETDSFPFTDNLTSIIPIDSVPHPQTLTIDQIEPSIPLSEYKLNHFIEQTNDTNLIDFSSSQEDYIETMNNQTDNKSSNSTRTSLSSIHDTHLDPNELAYRLARLDSMNISSPPKKTLADELAELGEQHHHQFESDSLDHSSMLTTEHPQEQSKIPDIDSLQSTPHTYSTTPPPPIHIDELTTIVTDIRNINQEKSISSLCNIVADIHAQTNNQFLTKIVSYHQSPPVANLQTIVTELHQTSSGKSIPRPQRPTHLELNTEEHEEENEQTSSPALVNNIPTSSDIISELEEQVSLSKLKSPSPSSPSTSPTPSPLPVSLPMTRRISDTSMQSARFHSQRIDKVSDLEIVKQGKGFKIGYVDRQGTDQRVILTKHIEAGPDIMARDPHVRLPYKGRKLLSQVYSSLLYTNGYNAIQEDKKFERRSNDIEVPIIGTNPQHFDESDMISIDIDGPSTMLNSICESIVITQGSVYSDNSLKPSREKSVIETSIPKSIFDNPISSSSSSSSRLRHVVLDHHEEYLLDSSRTPTPSTKKDKVEVIETWEDRTVIDGSSQSWYSSSLLPHKVNKHKQSTSTVEQFVSPYQPQTVQMRIAPSHDVKYRTSEQIQIPSVYDWTEETIQTPIKLTKTTRDIALSPIMIEQHDLTSTKSPKQAPEKVDRSCQYSLGTQDFGLQCRFDNLTSSTQVSAHDLPNFLVSYGGTQTVIDSTHHLDDSGIHTHMQTVSPSLSVVSSENQLINQPFTLSGPDFIRKLNEQRDQASALTVTQFTDDHYYLPSNDTNHTTTNTRPTTLERSADSGILVDDQSLRNRSNKANFALQVDIKGSSSDSDEISEVTQRPINRLNLSTNDGAYEHRSELVITTRNSSRNDQRYEHSVISSAKEIEQQILQLQRERAHILELLSLNWSRSNIWVELTEAKLNYIIGETDALLRSLSFDASPMDNERVKLKMHQYEEEMAELTRQRLAIYRERLEDSKRQIDKKIDELELKRSVIGQNASHYSTLEYTPRVNNNRYSKSYLSTSAENLTNMPVQDAISSHPQFLDVSFLTSTPANQNSAIPPRYPRVTRYPHQDIQRTVYRPTPRYPSTVITSNPDNRYDYPRYRSTSYVTPSSNLSGLQGLSKSQQAILDETDKLVRDSQQFHSESASQFERARESLLSRTFFSSYFTQ
ncbi:hypothetical protein I4U23_007709 [Adineta vaga]|nr:hypothetical protein I4U23_007709 [Adineta vaga]